jgi:hypothetical protein
MNSEKDFITLVRKMRAAQKRFFKAKPGSSERNAAFNDAVPLEKAVDLLLEQFENPQAKLFHEPIITQVMLLDNTRVKIEEKEYDGITNRISAGGDRDNGYYVIYRGNLPDVLRAYQITFEALTHLHSQVHDKAGSNTSIT